MKLFSFAEGYIPIQLLIIAILLSATMVPLSFAQPEWVLHYSGAGQLEDGPAAIEVDKHDNVYVAGYVFDSDSTSKSVTIKYNKHGEEEWVRYYGDSNVVSGATDIAVAEDHPHDVYVTGYSYDTDTTSSFFTIKYDKDGDLKWYKFYSSPGIRKDYSTAIALDEKSRNVYVTGYTFQTDTTSALITVKYSKNGEELGVEIYNGPMNANNGAASITVDKSGVYVSGYTHDSGSGQNITIIKYNASHFAPSDTLWFPEEQTEIDQ